MLTRSSAAPDPSPGRGGRLVAAALLALGLTVAPFSTGSTFDCDVTLRGVVVQEGRTAGLVEPPRDR